MVAVWMVVGVAAFGAAAVFLWNFIAGRRVRVLASPDEGPTVDGSDLESVPVRRSSWGLSAVLVGLALLLLVAGFFAPDINAIQQSAMFAAAAVLAILARIAQAGRHHAELMDELQRRR